MYMQRGYGAWFPIALSNKISNVGMDFVAYLLEKDVATRLTPIETLQHPFLKDESWIEWTAIQFIIFAKANPFKYVVAALFHYQWIKQRESHYQMVTEWFGGLEKDDQRKVSYDVFKQEMDRCQTIPMAEDLIQKIFKALSCNDENKIGLNDVLNAIVYHWMVSSDVRLYKTFRYLDENEKGTIPTQTIKRKVQESKFNSDLNCLLKSIDDIDLNNDGNIDYEEWLRALHPDFMDDE